MFGVKESTNENCIDAVVRVVNTHVKPDQPLQPQELEAAHRVGPPRRPLESGEPPKPRPIIVRFYSRARKYKVLENRKQLRTTEYSIAEDMTRLNFTLLNRVKNSANVGSSWFTNGKVKARHAVTDQVAIIKLFDKVEDCFQRVQ